MILDPGSRIQDILDPASWIQDPGSRILDPGSVIQDPGSRILDPGSVVQDPGSRIQEDKGEEKREIKRKVEEDTIISKTANEDRGRKRQKQKK